MTETLDDFMNNLDGTETIDDGMDSRDLFDKNMLPHMHGSVASSDDLSIGQSSLISFPVAQNHLLQPYDETLTTNLIYRAENPVGIYTIKNTYGYTGMPEVETYTHIDMPEDFTKADIQNACNAICDTLHWPHIPVSLTESVDNAAYNPGIHLHSTFDDTIKLSPKYAHDCIDHIGSTDIVISDLAHEVGHAVAINICGDMGTYMNEKMADFISGFVNGKMGVDIDSARKWFEWQYDGIGVEDYPVSEDRWDAEAAGYYFSHLANGEDLKEALKDPNFLDIIKAYQHDRMELVNEMAWNQNQEVNSSIFENIKDYGNLFLERVTDLNRRYHFFPVMSRWIKALHI